MEPHIHSLAESQGSPFVGTNYSDITGRSPPNNASNSSLAGFARAAGRVWCSQGLIGD